MDQQTDGAAVYKKGVRPSMFGHSAGEVLVKRGRLYNRVKIEYHVAVSVRMAGRGQ